MQITFALPKIIRAISDYDFVSVCRTLYATTGIDVEYIELIPTPPANFIGYYAVLYADKIPPAASLINALARENIWLKDTTITIQWRNNHVSTT